MMKSSTRMQRLVAAALLAGFPFAAGAQNKTATPPEQGTIAAKGSVLGPSNAPSLRAEGTLPRDRGTGKEPPDEQTGRLFQRDQATALVRAAGQLDEALDLLRQ